MTRTIILHNMARNSESFQNCTVEQFIIATIIVIALVTIAASIPTIKQKIRNKFF